MVYLQERGAGAAAIMAQPLAGGAPITVLDTPGLQATLPVFGVSPNGKWIAYTSAESGNYAVYVAPFPKGEGKWQVSNGNATAPAWRRDSKELFYLSVAGDLYTTEIRESGNELQLGTPKLLFRANIADGDVVRRNAGWAEFRDTGNRGRVATPLNFVTNFTVELKK